MKSLKALENKYILIREAATPPAAPAAPAAAPAAPAPAPAAPAPAPAATTATAATSAATTTQPSILTPEELKSLNVADSPFQPSKITAIAKDPQQLKTFSQNELPDIISGLVASITQTHPGALKELRDATKTNDINKLNSVLAKYAKLAPAAPGAVPATSVSAATPPTTGESIKLNEGKFDAVLNFFKKNKKQLAIGTVGFLLGNIPGAIILPLLVKALQSGKLDSYIPGSGKDKPITIQVSDRDRWESFKKLIISNNKPGQMARVTQVYIGLITDEELETYFAVLTSQQVGQIVDGAPLNLTCPAGYDTALEPQFQVVGERGVYVLKLTRDGNVFDPPPAPADPAADAAAAAKAKAAAGSSGAGPSAPAISVASYTPFTSLANKVLKEFHKNSKPLPIETANKK